MKTNSPADNPRPLFSLSCRSAVSRGKRAREACLDPSRTLKSAEPHARRRGFQHICEITCLRERGDTSFPFLSAGYFMHKTFFSLSGCAPRKVEAWATGSGEVAAAVGEPNAARKRGCEEEVLRRRAMLGPTQDHQTTRACRCCCRPQVLRCSSRRIPRVRLQHEHPLKVRGGWPWLACLSSIKDFSSRIAYAQDISTR